MEELINKIEQNQKTIDSYGKLNIKVLNKINYKLRLDWNYYSNKMEGGTLTKAETMSVMVQVLDVKGKPLKDVLEMSGHDKIVSEILNIVKGKGNRISEKRIKEIHSAIMHEPNPEKAKQIGIWKTVSNEIINYKGEKYTFVEPSEVADEMHSLLNKTNAEIDKFLSIKKQTKTPLEIATDFHLGFLSIHPFYDGNGRTARILTNIILLSCGLPAIIIKEENKKIYYQLLTEIQSYGADKELLQKYFADRLIETQELIIEIFNEERNK